MVLHWVVAPLITDERGPGLAADRLAGRVDPAGHRPAQIVRADCPWAGADAHSVAPSHPPPAMPAVYSRLERVGAHLAHRLLYGLILLLPISGWLHDRAFKDAAAHPLRLFWVIPWFRIGAIEHLAGRRKKSCTVSFSRFMSGRDMYCIGWWRCILSAR